MAEKVPRIVIVGGGFGGLYAARSLKDAPARVTVIDRRNFHLFQPLLYQVAIGGLSPADISSPLRGVFKRQLNTSVILAEAVDVDVEGRRVILSEGNIEYDFLVLATGSLNHYFGNDAWVELAPGLKTIEDATEIRRRALLAFEAAEWEPDPDRRKAWLSFVVIGGGATGVELAGALAELARDTLRQDFRNIDPTEAGVLLVEGGERVLPAFPPELSLKAVQSLARLGVEVRTRTLVTGLSEAEVVTSSGDGEVRIAARTVLWAAGVKPTPLGRILAERAGTPVDRDGRVIVGPDLSLPGHPEIFVIGDLANVSHQGGRPLPGVAPVAMQEGKYVAEAIQSRLRGEVEPPFRYRDRGNLATIGRAAAVADLGKMRFSGYPAWVVWLFVHLLYLVGFENRVLVLIQWAWNYFTRNRSARLITGVRGKNAAPGPPGRS